jgi:hypothetical protein
MRVLSSDTENYIDQHKEALWEARRPSSVVTVDFLDACTLMIRRRDLHSWHRDADANNGFLHLLSPGEGKAWLWWAAGWRTASPPPSWTDGSRLNLDDFDAGNTTPRIALFDQVHAWY